MATLQIDSELQKIIDSYRDAKTKASAARKQAAQVERVGHYDKDTPLQTRNAQEGEATADERSCALKLADEILTRLASSSA